MSDMAFQSDSRDRRLVLTFDDGPDDEHTPAVLEALKHYGVPAAFFCLGAQVEKHPDVLRRIVQSGHIVGNHSWSHPHLTKESLTIVVDELSQTSSIIAQTIGLTPRLFRPPYGDIDDKLTSRIDEMDYRIVLWDVDSEDWSGIPSTKIVANVVSRLKEKAILLHHSAGNVQGTVEALPYLIEVARSLGYEFVGLDELIDESAYNR